MKTREEMRIFIVTSEDVDDMYFNFIVLTEDEAAARAEGLDIFWDSEWSEDWEGTDPEVIAWEIPSRTYLGDDWTEQLSYQNEEWR